jgi:hypothetical protein
LLAAPKKPKDKNFGHVLHPSSSIHQNNQWIRLSVCIFTKNSFRWVLQQPTKDLMALPCQDPSHTHHKMLQAVLL